MRYLSPLRYPGGKGRLAPFIARLLTAQRVPPRVYAEPFAGGAGAALRLLTEEHVRSILINDLNPGIAAFWRALFYDTEDLARRIETNPVTLDEWHLMRSIYGQPGQWADLDLGFATFFLNRCNRSGILDARPIGGLDQSGRWKIDARFNRNNLAHRVRFLGQYRDRVTVSQLDGRDFLAIVAASEKSVFLYADPPYLVQGEDLYFDSMTFSDHSQFARLLRQCKFPWLLTYDARAEVTNKLYRGLRTAEFSIAHTAQVQHIGSEYAVFGARVLIPDLEILHKADAHWVCV